jgi:tRNA(adenine34) deaminase
MQKAYQEALKAADEGEVPIGAVIVKDGQVIGRGYNRIEHLRDATAHAEIIAMSAASASLETWRLDDCILYVTLEPCLMCLGAILQSRLAAIIYAARDPRLGAVDTFHYNTEAQRAYNWFPQVQGGVMAEECGVLLQNFFQKIRKKN